MALPPVIIFERHWEELPKKVVYTSLTDLSAYGYTHLCIEAPHNLTSEEIVEGHRSQLQIDCDLEIGVKSDLEKVGIKVEKLSDKSFPLLCCLFCYFVSSRRYMEVAERIKQLPASRILADIFTKSRELSISVKGVDISSNYDEMISKDLSERMPAIEDLEENRITTMFQNLLKQQEKGGFLFLCGAFHANRLIREFEEAGIFALFYFPHSSASYLGDINQNEVEELCESGPLRRYTHLLSQENSKRFSERILADITRNIRYEKPFPHVSTQTYLLNNYFKEELFQVFLRKDGFADALVDIEKWETYSENIQKTLQEVGIKTHSTFVQNKKHLAIFKINESSVFQKIRNIVFMKKNRDKN